MKTRRILIALTGLMACCQMTMAQAKIDRITEELEKKGVECDKVVTRDPKTKKVTSIVKSYEFYSKDGNYAKQLKKAFTEEAENATTEISENGGREWTLIFDTNEYHMLYVLEIGKQEPDPKVELNIIINYGKKKKNVILKGFGNGLESFDMEEFKNGLEQYGIDMEKFESNIQKYQRDIQKYQRDMQKFQRDMQKRFKSQTEKEDIQKLSNDSSYS